MSNFEILTTTNLVPIIPNVFSVLVVSNGPLFTRRWMIMPNLTPISLVSVVKLVVIAGKRACKTAAINIHMIANMCMPAIVSTAAQQWLNALCETERDEDVEKSCSKISHWIGDNSIEYSKSIQGHQ
ncbi:hypothetical protein SS1G_10877 [Sclerotinia sclerotiorum 1980 UF-70]|uniref:Uncharacterized protein n=1 Tax=Sclerotinia sclerotiorum (strain ATCC 18683 / 1980 / Ss-1) TaxID=665079 RepID=A7EZW0_SCLS1|nr:hypothetical protein SS1G_10877 [Sclerotinia sclerotiorum 1980 UF-70]EDN95002.1 hypothetical protein SS1G_10877 [Sclerotinia sclerotiorum 1980 UF-70]